MKTKSEKQCILDHLSRGHKLTPQMALARFGCMSLSQRIGELIRDGHKIVRDRLKIDNKTTVGLYYMKKGRAR